MRRTTTSAQTNPHKLDVLFFTAVNRASKKPAIRPINTPKAKRGTCRVSSLQEGSPSHAGNLMREKNNDRDYQCRQYHPFQCVFLLLIPRDLYKTSRKDISSRCEWIFQFPEMMLLRGRCSRRAGRSEFQSARETRTNCFNNDRNPIRPGATPTSRPSPAVKEQSVVFLPLSPSGNAHSDESLISLRIVYISWVTSQWKSKSFFFRLGSPGGGASFWARKKDANRRARWKNV